MIKIDCGEKGSKFHLRRLRTTGEQIQYFGIVGKKKCWLSAAVSRWNKKHGTDVQIEFGDTIATVTLFGPEPVYADPRVGPVRKAIRSIKVGDCIKLDRWLDDERMKWPRGLDAAIWQEQKLGKQFHVEEPSNYYVIVHRIK